jgi:hypothetical protein
MAEFLPFLSNQSAFEPEVTRAMAFAFEDICRMLGVTEADDREREVIAARIVELARRGERDARQLRDRVLHEAGGDRSYVLR